MSEKSEIGRSRGAGEVPKLIRLLVEFCSGAIGDEVPAAVDGRGGSVNSNEDENGIPLPIPIPIPILPVSGMTTGAAYIWYPLPRNCSCIRRGSLSSILKLVMEGMGLKDMNPGGSLSGKTIAA